MPPYLYGNSVMHNLEPDKISRTGQLLTTLLPYLRLLTYSVPSTQTLLMITVCSYEGNQHNVRTISRVDLKLSSEEMSSEKMSGEKMQI